MALHEVPLERRTLHGHFSRDLPPVATIDSGDTIVLSTLPSGWFVEPGREFPQRDLELDSGHALVGPLEIRGARAGQTLEIAIGRVTVGSWGLSSGGLHWELDAEAGIGRDDRGRELDLRPFPGVLGMPPPEAGRHPTPPPRVWGGNLDCKELVEGTRLYLPIPVDGALFSAGDGHARQGDGEVAQLAIECGLARLELTLSVRDDPVLEAPVAWTPEAWIAFGLHKDLDEAAAQATAGAVRLLQREHGLEDADAFALASLVVDLRVTQVVNGVKGVHAMVPHGAIRFAKNP